MEGIKTILTKDQIIHRDALIVGMVKEGYLTKDIMREHGFSKDIILKTCVKHGIRTWRGKLNKFQELALVEDYKNGVQIQDLYTKYDITDVVVWNTLDKYKIDRTRKRTYEDLDEGEVIKDYLDGMLVDEIMAKWNFVRSKFFSILKNNQIEPNRNLSLTETQKDEIVKRYLNKENVYDFCSDYDRTAGVLYNILEEKGVETRGNLIIKAEQYTEITKRYLDGESANDICPDYDVGPGCILYHLKKNGIEIRDFSHCNRIYDVNENYFDELNTPEKAYWLGFLWGDGCNATDNNSIMLSLKASDIEHIAKFVKALGSNHPIATRKGITPTGKEKYYSVVSITNKHLSEKLESYGMIKNKTCNLRWPEALPEEFANHFIRGKFDADGCLCVTNPRKFYFCVTSFKGFLKELGSRFSKNADVTCLISDFYSKPESSAGNIWIAGNRQILKVLNWMFRDHGGFYLERKYELYKKALTLYRDINGSEQMEQYLHAH